MARNRVLVWGAGGHGKVVVDALMLSTEWEIAGIIDEDSKKNGAEVLRVKVSLLDGDLLETARRFKCNFVAIAIGDNYVRHEKFQQIRNAGLEPVNVMHPSAQIS